MEILKKMTVRGEKVALVSYPVFSCTYCHYSSEFVECPRKANGKLACTVKGTYAIFKLTKDVK